MFFSVQVLRWQEFLRIPSHPPIPVSHEAKSLIRGLINSPDRRLGGREGGSVEIKAHPFFASIDWSRDMRQQEAVYKPKLRHETDTSNFDTINEPDSDDDDDSGDGGTAGDDPQEGNYIRFGHFTFRRFFEGGDHLYGFRGGAGVNEQEQQQQQAAAISPNQPIDV